MATARHYLLSKISPVWVACIALGFVGETFAQSNSEPCWAAGSLVFPAGDKREVIQQTVDFLVEHEKVPAHPYWPGGLSGITIGVGWDIGQHTKEDLAAAWSKLPPNDIELLQRASKKTRAAASQLLPQVKTVAIPHDLAMDVLVQMIRESYYPTTAKVFPGLELLPTEAQVALTSVVFNRGAAMGSDPDLANRNGG
jgi:hypothetical protein